MSSARARRAAALLCVLALMGCAGEDRSSAAELTISAAGGEGEIQALQGLVAAFEDANPGVDVRLDTAPDAGELVASLTTAFAGGRPPDVFVLNYRRLGSFAARGVVDPVPSGRVAGLYPKPLEAFTFDRTLLCQPSNAASMVVYVNPDLFARSRVPLPRRGWTWADLLRTAQQLSAGGTKAIGFDPALIRLAPFVWSNGGELVDDVEQPTAVDLSSPQARQAIAFLLDLQRFGLSATDRAAQDPEEAFAAGRTAMHLDSRRSVPGFRTTQGLTFDVVPVPTKATATATSVLHSDGYCVTRASRNRALAHAFADFAVNGEGARLLAESGRTVPVRQAVAQSPSFLQADAEPRSSQVFLDQLARVRSLPHVPRWNEAEAAADEVLAQLFAGRTTIARAVSDIRSQTKAKLSGR